MPYTHTRFLFRRDGAPSDEHGTGGVPAGTDPGSIGWIRPAGSRILRVDTGDMYVFDGANWDQQLNADSTFSDAADSRDVVSQSIAAPAAQTDTYVHAAVAASAANLFPGPVTNPDVPRNVKAVFQAGWDGGDITVVGTDVADAANTEVIADTPGATVVGTKVFKTVTSITKELIGVTANTCSIGIGVKLGLTSTPAEKNGILTRDGASELGTWDETAQSMGVTPTNLPNGAANYQAIYARAGQTSTVTATP